MIDIHSHILFGVDDGAKTLEGSLELINEEIEKGVEKIILTPHFKKKQLHAGVDVINENFKVLCEAVKSNKLNVQLFLGCEVYLDYNYHHIIWEEPIITLADSDYVLIEFSMSDTPKNIPEICYELGIKGDIPIIAHIERYDILYDNKQLIKEILNEGAHFQVNASSVINRENKESCKFVNYLLKNELVSFVASDVHNKDSRKFYLDEAYKVVSKTCNYDYAVQIFKDNPENIIMNKYFDNPKLEIKKGFLSRLFK